MARDPELDATSGKSRHERFTDLGKRLLAVPKSEIDKRETEWQRKHGKSDRKKR